MRLKLLIFAVGVIFFTIIILNLTFVDDITMDPSIPTSFSNCSSNWYITGYFTPVESDYYGDLKKIVFGDEIKHFKSDFLT